jgi:hypothetical protein
MSQLEVSDDEINFDSDGDEINSNDIFTDDDNNDDNDDDNNDDNDNNIFYRKLPSKKSKKQRLLENPKKLDFSIINKYADIIIVCDDGAKLYCSKFILSKNKYFNNLLIDNDINKLELQSNFSKNIMNIILTIICYENVMHYINKNNATILYEASKYYMMDYLHDITLRYIINRIEEIKIDSRFIKSIYLYQDIKFISHFQKIPYGFLGRYRGGEIKIDEHTFKHCNVELNIDAQIFVYLIGDIDVMDDDCYTFLLIVWIKQYKDIDDSIIKYILNKHKLKILSLDRGLLYCLCDYLKTSSYIESSNFLKIEAFDIFIKSKDDVIRGARIRCSILIDEITNHKTRTRCQKIDI